MSCTAYKYCLSYAAFLQNSFEYKVSKLNFNFSLSPSSLLWAHCVYKAYLNTLQNTKKKLKQNKKTYTHTVS